MRIFQPVWITITGGFLSQMTPFYIPGTSAFESTSVTGTLPPPPHDHHHQRHCLPHRVHSCTLHNLPTSYEAHSSTPDALQPVRVTFFALLTRISTSVLSVNPYKNCHASLIIRGGAIFSRNWNVTYEHLKYAGRVLATWQNATDRIDVVPNL